MEFKSIEEVNAFVEKVVAEGMEIMGNEMVEIMKDEIRNKIYQDHPNTTGTRTGQLENSPEIVEKNNNSVTTEYLDNGEWTSLFGKSKGNHFFPLDGYLKGTVLAPNGGHYSANPHESAMSKCESEIPRLLVDFLRSRGIPIE